VVFVLVVTVAVVVISCCCLISSWLCCGCFMRVVMSCVCHYKVVCVAMQCLDGLVMGVGWSHGGNHEKLPFLCASAVFS
jgi:hypothetical protein